MDILTLTYDASPLHAAHVIDAWHRTAISSAERVDFAVQRVIAHAGSTRLECALDVDTLKVLDKNPPIPATEYGAAFQWITAEDRLCSYRVLSGPFIQVRCCDLSFLVLI